MELFSKKNLDMDPEEEKTAGGLVARPVATPTRTDEGKHVVC
jgi:hypothetical protein